MLLLPRAAPWASFPWKYTHAGRRPTGTDSLLTEMFKSELLSSYPELLLQAQPVVGRPGVVKPLQMALQRAHIELCVSIQVVLQQSLVDEGVLHLRRKREGSQEVEEVEVVTFMPKSVSYYFCITDCACFRRPRLFTPRVELSVQGTASQRGSTLTSVWMSWQRCSRILLTKPKTSTLWSMCIMSIMLSMTMNVPVLPTPALQKHKQEEGTSSSLCRHKTKMCRIRTLADILFSTKGIHNNRST